MDIYLLYNEGTSSLLTLEEFFCSTSPLSLYSSLPTLASFFLSPYYLILISERFPFPPYFLLLGPFPHPFFEHHQISIHISSYADLIFHNSWLFLVILIFIALIFIDYKSNSCLLQNLQKHKKIKRNENHLLFQLPNVLTINLLLYFLQGFLIQKTN